MNQIKYQKCPICNSPAEMSDISYIHENVIDCYRCGKYKITSDAIEDFGNFSENQIAIISGWIRENRDLVVDNDKFILFKELNIPTVGEKAIKLLKYIAKERPIPGKNITIDFQSIYNLKTINEQTEYPQIVFENLKKFLPFLSITWSVEGNDLRYLIEDYLINEKKYLKGNKKYKITPKGWAYLDSLKYKDVDSQIAFIAMWFDKKMDYLFEYLKSAVLKAGYEPKRVDKHEHVNRVDDEIIALIRQSKFIIADFTGQRGGVYFESGFAHGINIPVIWLCNNKEKKKLHFDTNHFNYIFWDQEKLDELEQNLTKRIEHVLGKGTYNPE